MLLAQLRANLKKLLEERTATQADLDAVTTVAEQRGDGTLTDEETARFGELRSKLADIDARRNDLQARIAELEEIEASRKAADDLARSLDSAAADEKPHVPTVTITREARQYEGRAGAYLADLVKHRVLGDESAAERLHRHAQEMQVERRDVGRSTDAELGYFVPPLYAISDYAELARAARPFADLIGSQPLPAGIDGVKVPRITTGTKVAVQDGDNTAITTQDVVSAETTADLVTVAGYVDVSVQALDQSPVDMQSILFEDLIADYAMQLDTLLLSGSGTNGQPIGVLNLGGTNGITYTDSTPTVGELYGKVGDGIQQIHTGRYLPAQVIVAAPRRWHWIASRVDSDGRPLAGFAQSMPQNVPAYVERVTAEARGGVMQNLPVILDANVPTNLGTGTNEDRLIVARVTDTRLWEGTPRLQVTPITDASSETLTVRLKFWRYVIFLPGRFPKSYSVVSGTGLTTPTF